MGDDRSPLRAVLYGAVVVAVLAAAAGGVWLLASGSSGDGPIAEATSAERPEPDKPPVEWQPMDAATAATVTAFLDGPGAVLGPLTEQAAALFDDGADEKDCSDVAAGIGAIDANAALTAAAEVPDVPLQHMYVNLTGQISRVLGMCTGDAPAADLVAAREDLATLCRYIAVRLTQVEEAL